MCKQVRVYMREDMLPPVRFMGFNNPDWLDLLADWQEEYDSWAEKQDDVDSGRAIVVTRAFIDGIKL